MLRVQNPKYQMIVLRYILSDYWKRKQSPLKLSGIKEYGIAENIVYECIEGILDCPIKKPKYGIKRTNRVTCEQQPGR